MSSEFHSVFSLFTLIVTGPLPDSCCPTDGAPLNLLEAMTASPPILLSFKLTLMSLRDSEVSGGDAFDSEFSDGLSMLDLIKQFEYVSLHLMLSLITELNL